MYACMRACAAYSGFDHRLTGLAGIQAVEVSPRVDAQSGRLGGLIGQVSAAHIDDHHVQTGVATLETTSERLHTDQVAWNHCRSFGARALLSPIDCDWQ